MNLPLLLLFITFVSCKNWAEVNIKDDEVKEPPIVKIKDGVIRGAWGESTNGRQFARFDWIPYAKPPIGELRFKPPQPAEPWSGIFNATGPYKICLQYEPFFSYLYGSEDCLLINVYTPHANSWANMPVMVFIHGGAFFSGAGFSHDPVRIMDWDMVVVTFNYRLGPLGFLSTGDEVIPGNAGLKDQVMALRWVQDNIRAFGGDPDSVTLTGFSAGAASVHYHYLSPLSKGLFKRGIAFSGSALSPWAFATNPARKAKSLAATLGCPIETSQDVADCLMSKPAVDIVNATSWMFGKQFWFSPFVPSAEPEGVEGAFITKHPYEAAKSGAVNDLPLLATTTADEGLYPAAAYREILPELEEAWQEKAPKLFQFEDTLPKDQWARVAAKIKEHYLEGKPVSEETFPNLVQAVGDRIFVAGIGKMAELHAATSNQSVHMYKYSIKETSYHLLGEGHGDDLSHIFFLSIIPFKESGDEPQINDLMITLLYKYCKSGIPKLPEGAPEWSPLKPGKPELDYMLISSPTDLQRKTNSNFGQRDFWDSLGFNENENYKRNLI